jgi:prepilin peptidase CpaA
MREVIEGRHLAPLLALAPLLMAVALSDLKKLKIPNSYCLATVTLFIVAVFAGMAPDYSQRLWVAATVLAVGFGAYCLGLFGGGDVKFLSALLLFIPADSLQVYALVFAAAMLIGIVGFMSLKRLPAVAKLPWRSLVPGRQLPMGVPLALSGLLHPLVMVCLPGAS